MALETAELRDRVDTAERLLASGDRPRSFAEFSKLFHDIVLDAGEVSRFGYNEFLVMHRYADVAVQAGHVEDAFELYLVIQQQALDPEARAMGAFKRLQIAVQTGHGQIAKETFDGIVNHIWVQPPPSDLSAEALAAWEATLGWGREDRPALLAQMYLALGRLYNALRKIGDSSHWLQRGLWHAEGASGTAASMATIPLYLALANNHLSCGDLKESRRTLALAAQRIGDTASGATYSMWQREGEAKLAFLEGRLASAVKALEELENAAKGSGLARTVCECLLWRAEILILLNLLPEADQCLHDAESLTQQDATLSDLRESLSRVRFFRASRARLFSLDESGRSAAEMQDPSAERSVPEPIVQGRLRDDVLTWSGDCLRDFEIREAFVYANLERNPEEAKQDLADLWRDFEETGSRLMLARLHLLSGLLFSRYKQLNVAAPELDQARKLFMEIGAERELYQTTLYLAWTIRVADPEKYRDLLQENDVRVNSLAEGLSTEQRNALIANKYSAVEENQRVGIEQILAFRRQAIGAPWWKRLSCYLRYWGLLHEFIRGLDGEQERRRRKSRDAAPGAQNSGRLSSLLWRLAFHERDNQTVGYVVLPDRTFLFSVRRWHIDCRLIELGRLAVSVLVKEVHESLTGEEPGRYDQIARSASQRLAMQEILAGVPRRIRSLTILPDAALRLLPFCALRFVQNDGTEAYIIERAAVNFDNVSTPRKRPTHKSGERVAVVSHYSGVERRLDRSAEAAGAAAQWLRSNWKMSCREADDKEGCLSALDQAAVFYYFGHGHFHDADPERSGLEFRAPRGTTVLSIRDLDGTDFFNLEQAVILACHSSDAVPFSGRWVVSLPELLVRRGARSVLGAVWQPDQSIAAEVSSRFFERAESLGRARALQEIQRDLIARGSSREPFWWAALQIYGDGGRLQNPGKRGLWRKTNSS
jgi:tetratricopeptide (TPR) repeat protein